MDSRKEMLKKQFPRVGRVEWIGTSPGSRQPIVPVDSAQLVVGSGVQGDYHDSAKRQVTLIQKEHFPAIAALAGLDEVTYTMMRRNLVVSGINLMALKGRRFRVGGALLEGTDDCEPCHRIEENLGTGGYNAANSMGGLIADVIEAGAVAVGDAVTAVV